MPRKKYIYYCEKCGKWRGNKKKCPECEVKTKKKEIPKARGNYYFIDGVDEPLDRVTNIISKVLRKKGLEYWMRKVSVEKALETLDRDKGMRAMYDTRDKAGQRGTDIHKIIEQIVTGGKVDHEKVNKLPKIRAWKKFRNDFNFDVLETEKIVYNAEKGFAGKTDAIIQTYNLDIVKSSKKKKLSDDAEVLEKTKGYLKVKQPKDKILVDWKTGKNVYNEAQIQSSAYFETIEDDLDRIWIIHLQEDSYNIVEFKPRYDIFEAVLKIYRWM